MKRFRVTLEDRTYEVVVENPDANPVRVTVDGEGFEIPLESLDDTPGEQTQRVASSPTASRPAVVPARAEPDAVSGHVVRAPMPGTISKFITRGKINPLIGAAGISAFPMSGRLAQKVAHEEDFNFLMMHAMGANTSGQIGSVIAGGVLLALVEPLVKTVAH